MCFRRVTLSRVIMWKFKFSRVNLEKHLWAEHVTVYFYQANIFDRHIYCVGSLESSPNTPVPEKSSDVEIYLELLFSVQQSQRSVVLQHSCPGGQVLLPVLPPALLEQRSEHHHTAMSAGRSARGALPATETFIFLMSPTETTSFVDKRCPISDLAPCYLWVIIKSFLKLKIFSPTK